LASAKLLRIALLTDGINFAESQDRRNGKSMFLYQWMSSGVTRSLVNVFMLSIRSSI